MRYDVRYYDSRGCLGYRKQVDYDGPAEGLLQHLCAKYENDFQRMHKGIAEKVPEYKYSGKPAYRFQISENEAKIYLSDEDFLVMVITAKPAR